MRVLSIARSLIQEFDVGYVDTDISGTTATQMNRCSNAGGIIS